jgi:hypothetical protein
VSHSQTAKSSSAKLTPVSAESNFSFKLSDLEKKVDTRLSNIESRFTSFEQRIDQKIDNKFDQIIKKLDGQNFNSGGNRGRGRGWYHNKEKRGDADNAGSSSKPDADNPGNFDGSSTVGQNTSSGNNNFRGRGRGRGHFQGSNRGRGNSKNE